MGYSLGSGLFGFSGLSAAKSEAALELGAADLMECLHCGLYVPLGGRHVCFSAPPDRKELKRLESGGF